MLVGGAHILGKAAQLGSLSMLMFPTQTRAAQYGDTFRRVGEGIPDAFGEYFESCVNILKQKLGQSRWFVA